MGKYFNETRETIIKLINSDVREGNETFRGLNIQLIFFAATVLSFSLLIFLNKDITTHLDHKEKYLLISTWIILGLSLIFGIIQFFSTYIYFKKCFNCHKFILNKMENEDDINKIKKNLNIQDDQQGKNIDEEFENVLDKLIYNEISKETLKKYPDIAEISSEIWIKIQVFLIIISLILLILFMSNNLLKFWNNNILLPITLITGSREWGSHFYNKMMNSIISCIKNNIKIILLLALLFNLVGAFLLFISVKKDDRMLFDDSSGKKFTPVALLVESKAKLGIIFIIISILINIIALPFH